ncbi:viperin family antiviral radical SAM protein [Thalassotalea sp. Y01]|uniref:viperin family antiviral radical SAM protein n=1 Tax=Thalassotalea sp. Y01 TaxID=2729613 RepID=UPI00145ED0E5|nr:viperin family antiviral radical SAM protein [Thalassotalea sp. Y01]NMP16525.1 radical SAM protein [Thalassotalea sp. Y01]
MSKNLNSFNEIVINWHITEVCNYSCEYCFAKWGRPNELHRQPFAVENLIQELASYFFSEDCSFKKVIPFRDVRINFAGGEPFILGRRFIDIIYLAKSYGFKVSIITNGHFLYNNIDTVPNDLFDMVGISFDSQNVGVSKAIGRVDRKGQVLSKDNILALSEWVRADNNKSKFKVNTVVNQLNVEEDFSEFIKVLSPDKWKLFQVKPFNGHNLLINDEQFRAFVQRHCETGVTIFDETNDEMTESYLMIDPKGRFYQSSTESTESGHYSYSDVITEVGAERAIKQIRFSANKYLERYVPNNDIVINGLAL